MKSQIKLFYFMLVLGVVGFISSCDKDDPAAPVITFADTGVTPQLKFGETYNFSFSVVADGGYKSHNLDSVEGSIDENSSTPGAGTKSFTISGVFTAGNTAGPEGIKLTVTDGNGKSSIATIGLEIIQ